MVITTPNVEYNVRFENLPAQYTSAPGPSLRMDTTRICYLGRGVAERHGYEVVMSGIGPVDAEVGSPTQMAVFSR